MKCSHGATVGALDADSLFYLRARGTGIPGHIMLVEAFLHEAVETVTDETLRGADARAWWSRQRRWRMDTLAPATRRHAHPAGFPDPSQPQARGRPLVFLDSGLCAKAAAVIDAMVRCMETAYANVHRGAYRLSELATTPTKRREALPLPQRRRPARDRSPEQHRGDEPVAHSWGRGVMKPGQAVLISELEHHANIVPWQMLRDDKGNELRVAASPSGELDMTTLRPSWPMARSASPPSRICRMCWHRHAGRAHVALAHAHAKVLLDGSQAAVHRRVDVQAIGCDFYCFTGQFSYGPTGIGVLWARLELLDRMPPMLGGDMISYVT